jgi:DNA-binding PadR family transcriptional regulator
MHQYRQEASGETADPRRGCGGHGPREFAFHHHSHMGPHGPLGHGFGPFGRAKRGNVRAAILAVLAEEPMHGYQIMQQLQERSGGMWRFSPGSVYPTLQLLEDQGLVKSDEVEGKRVFSLTDEGRTEAEQLKQRGGAAPWDTSFGADDPRLKVRQAFVQLIGAFKQIASSGTPEQMERAIEIITEARKKIYAILAEEE